MQPFDEVWRSVQGIDGWLTQGQAEMLYRSAAAVADGEAIVEIGSHHGRSTVILGGAKAPGRELIAIDPFGDPRWGGGTEALSVFRANIAEHGLDDEVRLIRDYGAAAGSQWDGAQVGMLFVDGAHDYPTVTADLKAWLPHLAAGATVLMHDAYSSPGVTRAAFHQFFAARDFEYVGASRSLIAFRRGELSQSARALSAGRMLARLPWLARNLTIKVALRQGWDGLPALLGHRDAACPY
jgi:predicted O-methyltransferase YrrM